MSRRGAVAVRVENQLVRYSAPEPFGHDEVVDQLGGKRNGKVVILALKTPRATLLVDEAGRLVVHGTNRNEVARAAAREMLLRLGRPDEGLTAEKGPMVASFDYGQPLRTDRVSEFFPEAELDERLECLRINDENHGMDLLFFSNGRGVALGALSLNLVKMAASHWGSRFEAQKLFVEVLVPKGAEPEGEVEEESQPQAEESENAPEPEEPLDIEEDGGEADNDSAANDDAGDDASAADDAAAADTAGDDASASAADDAAAADTAGDDASASAADDD
jgi:TATA-box binding protein (TBP) (component of TFIID and TFIIIB)